MVNVLAGTRPCRFVGGPMDGYRGDYVDNGQTTAYFGENGGFVYVLDERESTKTLAVWRYSRTQSTAKMRALGLLGPGETA